MTMPASNVSLTYVRDNMFRDSSIPLNLNSTYYRDAALMPSPGNVSLAAFNNRANGFGRTLIKSQDLGLQGAQNVKPYHADLRIDNRDSSVIDTYGSVIVESGLPQVSLSAIGLPANIPTALYANFWFYCERIGVKHYLKFECRQDQSKGTASLQHQVLAYNNGYLQGLSTNLVRAQNSSAGSNSWSSNVVEFTPTNADRPFIVISVLAFAGGWDGVVGYENYVSGSYRYLEVVL